MATKIGELEGTRITRIYSSKFYFFKYITHAPGNDYYNIFPLVFSLGRVPKEKKRLKSDMESKASANIFRGLDFHYLPPDMRILLLDEMKKISPSLFRSPIQFAKYFQDIMWKVRKWRPARVCYRHYKMSNVRGRKIIRIERPDWDRVLVQPKVENFVTSTFTKFSSERVWKLSLIEMRKPRRRRA